MQGDTNEPFIYCDTDGQATVNTEYSSSEKTIVRTAMTRHNTCEFRSNRDRKTTYTQLLADKTNKKTLKELNAGASVSYL